jgi:hypothetical protein
MEKEDVLFLVDQRGRASNRTGLEGQIWFQFKCFLEFLFLLEDEKRVKKDRVGVPRSSTVSLCLLQSCRHLPSW